MEKGYFMAIPIEKITLGERLLPKIEDEIMEKMIESIDMYGFIQPLVVVKSGGKYYLAAGYSRYEAAVKLKMEEVPCIVYEGDEFLSCLLQIDSDIIRRHIDKEDLLNYYNKRRELIFKKRQEYIPEFQKLIDENALFKKFISRLENVKKLSEEEQELIITLFKNALKNNNLNEDDETNNDIDEEKLNELLQIKYKEKMDIINEKIENLEKELEAAKSGTENQQVVIDHYKKLVNKELEKKKVELEMMYKNDSPQFRKLIEEERKNIQKKFEEEILNSKKEMEKLVKIVKEKNAEIDKQKEEYKKLKELLDEASKALKKKEDTIHEMNLKIQASNFLEKDLEIKKKEIENNKNEINVLKKKILEKEQYINTLTAPENIISRLQVVVKELQSITSLFTASFNMISERKNEITNECNTIFQLAMFLKDVCSKEEAKKQEKVIYLKQN